MSPLTAGAGAGAGAAAARAPAAAVTDDGRPAAAPTAHTSSEYVLSATAIALTSKLPRRAAAQLDMTLREGDRTAEQKEKQKHQSEKQVIHAAQRLVPARSGRGGPHSQSASSTAQRWPVVRCRHGRRLRMVQLRKPLLPTRTESPKRAWSRESESAPG